MYRELKSYANAGNLTKEEKSTVAFGSSFTVSLATLGQ
jgi:hypothetical protein